MFSTLQKFFSWKEFSDEEFRQQQADLFRKLPLPVIWLVGKTGSGKTSIIRHITGATDAEIGNGFAPQTKTLLQYDFPCAETPIVRFLDTRGLGEAEYQSADDIAAAEAQSHVVVFTVRLMDHAVADVLELARRLRADQPTRPAILAVTCLHEAYPRAQHPDPDPFANNYSMKELPTWPTGLAADFDRALTEQARRFAGLVDYLVPIDLTRPEEGFAQPDFGGHRLQETLIEALPAIYRQTLLSLEEMRTLYRDRIDREAGPLILMSSSLAATAAAAPLPWVDMPVVLGIQSHLAARLAALYGQPMDRNFFASVLVPMSGRVVGRMLMRSPLKLIPVLGYTANAAMAFAFTFSMGKALCWYFSRAKSGMAPSQADLDEVWSDQYKQAMERWRETMSRKPSSAK